MPLPKALGMYADIKQVFDLCLKSGPLTVDFPTPAQASQFRQRAYYYRKLLHSKQLDALGLPIAVTATPYDSIKLTILKDRPCAVRVAEVSLLANVTLDSGETVSLEKVAEPLPLEATVDDPLMLAAQQLAKDLE